MLTGPAVVRRVTLEAWRREPASPGWEQASEKKAGLSARRHFAKAKAGAATSGCCGCSTGADEVQKASSHLASRGISGPRRVCQAQSPARSPQRSCTASPWVFALLLKMETYCTLGNSLIREPATKPILLRKNTYPKTLSALLEDNVLL